MLKAHLKLAAILFILCSAGTWSQAAGSQAACCNFANQCSQMTDQQILDAARNKAFGTCYYHEQCSICLCPFYVKVSYYNGSKGYDGGSGCLHSPADVASTLRRLCQDGVCCCPNLPPNPCEDPTPVRARNSDSGACCTFPNRCTIPPGWTIGGCDF